MSFNNWTKEIIIWVDCDKRVEDSASTIESAGYQLRYFSTPEECIGFIRKYISVAEIVGIISSMMRNDGRQKQNLMDAFQMKAYIEQNFLSSMICKQPVFGIISSSANHAECIKHGIEIFVKSRIAIQERVIQKIKKRNENGNNSKYITDDYKSDENSNNNNISTSIKSKMIVIGISGATRSGKGTLAQNLIRFLGSNNCQCISQDRYFNVNKIRFNLDGNWDCPQALHHELFFKAISSAVAAHATAYLILEGFMMFYEQRVLNLLDFKFWIEINKRVCYQRRMATTPVPEVYFQTKLWPNYLSYRKVLFGDSLVNNSLRTKFTMIIDGTLKPQKILEIATKSMNLDHDTSLTTASTTKQV